MKYLVIAHILNVDNFYKEYDNYDEAKKKYDKLLEWMLKRLIIKRRSRTSCERLWL